MLRNMMILGLISALFGCGDGKPGLFSATGYHVGKQKVWYKTSLGASYGVSEVVGADPKTFEERTLESKVIKGATAFYGFDRNSIFWAGYKIEGADLASFEYLCNTYSRDKYAAYYMAERLTEDVAHLEVVNWDFIKDSAHVYFGRDVFSDDPAHFTAVDGEGSTYYKDSKNCWYGIYKLEGADPATIRYIGQHTAADAKRIYYEMNEVVGADLKTYQVLEGAYAKDARHVYLNTEVMEGVNPATFQLLRDNYSKDDKHCYYYSMPVPDADPATFQIIEGSYVKDARRVFVIGKQIEGADPATFRVLNGQAGCSCDAKHAYTMERRIEGVDPQTFPAKGECKSCNESGVTF